MARPFERTFKVASQTKVYSGVQATLKIPTALTLSSGNQTDYLTWYIGFTDAGGRSIEAGISYSKKNTPNAHFRKMINTSCGNSYSEMMTVQPSSGNLVNIKLINNGNSTASLYIRGDLVTTISCSGLATLTEAKLVHGTEGNDCKYTNAEFQSAQYRNSSGTWVSWTTGYVTTAATGSSVSPIVVANILNPLKTSAG